MTPMPYTCDDFDAALPERLDGTLPADAAAAAEAHRAGCARCAALVADLEGLMSNARTMPDLAPSRDLWPAIAERIAPRMLELPARPAVRQASAAPWRRWAAAAALVAVSVGGTYVAMRPRGDSRSGGATLAEGPGQPRTPKPIAVSRPSAVETLSGEVRSLEDALAQRTGELDPKTVAVIQQSLQIIDRAISDARTALAADPSNPLLDEQLTRVLGKKVELMRRAVVLPART